MSSPSSPRRFCLIFAVGKRPDVRPTADCGYKAASTASAGPVSEGNVGAGAGATVGKMGGRGAMKGGLGSAAIALPNGLIVAALVATNAAGDIVDSETGQVIAGARTADGKSLVDVRKLLRAGTLGQSAAPRAGENTTLAVVATNARLTKTDINRVALMADDGFARAINPSHTTGDGDTVFALATGRWDGPGERDRHRRPGRRGGSGGDRARRVQSRVDRRHSVRARARHRSCPHQMTLTRVSRRQFVRTGLNACAAVQLTGAPAIVKSDAARPAMPQGVASGDVTDGRAVVWSRSDRPARMLVEYSTSDRFETVLRRTGPAALESTDFTARVVLTDLPPNQRIFYRVTFQDLADLRALSEPQIGSFRTPPTLTARRDVTLSWSADTVGQGWGINPSWGGLRLYDTMRRAEPDLFIHCGDTIYADGVLQPEVKLDDGSIWKNVVTEAKSKVAQTVDDYRGNYKYNLLDDHMRRFNAEVPQISLWDDHEVRDNWYETRDLSADDRYQVKSMALLSARARQAFLEFNPIAPHADDVAAHLPDDSIRAAARHLRARPAQLSRRQQRQPPDGAHAGVVSVRQRAVRRGEGRPGGQPRGVEGDRDRPAAGADRRRRQGAVRGVRQRRQRSAARPRARDRRAAPLHPRPPHPQRGLDHRRRPLLRRAPLSPDPREVHRVRPVLGVRGRPAARRHVRAEHARPDVRAGGQVQRRADRASKATGRRATAISSSAR